MCLHPRPVEPVPEETVRVARAAFPRGNRYLLMRDELGAIFEDAQFTHLFPTRGKPALSPWRLALVTVMQFAEGLSDRQAAEAVRARIDWKYALSLELDDRGFDASVLCEFRARLAEGAAEELLFDVVLERFRAMGLLKARGRQRTDSTHVLAAVRRLNRLERVGETVRLALNALATVAPEWLKGQVRPEWADRYARPFDDIRLPKGENARRAVAERIGKDGFELLGALASEDAAAWLREIPAVETLRRVWVQQYLRTPEGIRWRSDEDGLPPAPREIDSPVDPDARHSKKNSTSWLGYRVHLTETCDDGAPRILTRVGTATAPTQDDEATAEVHQDLRGRGLLPRIHLVDSAYLDADLLAISREDYGIDLLGPARRNKGWQARERTGFDQSNFEIDWDKEHATCPEGKRSLSWVPGTRRGKPVVWAQFARKDCGACPSQKLCLRHKPAADGRKPRKQITLLPRERHEALKAAREREKTPEYAREYRRRAGVEGTISRAVRICRIRRSRYLGLEKTRLQHLLSAAALNFVRLSEWISDTPPPEARVSPFSKLMNMPA
ncbi:IS1182 family transposase [Rubrobacter radiotolerans]|uniref:IS1182 family transposase n=1 Tax=Rubrobacter radiotolerans TaxID=42256 RepID=A0AB35T5L8_RUBRA|nr:IS1182 family transposase [Rubrobacter radiotolerans]MDX5895174.1 IS1182 family transposase [Rubrobacter radiotolerans]SMC07593.1 transposase [Rubrobacter radiotolerans DSM 5868]